MNKSQIRAKLKDSVLAPNKNGTFKIIADVGNSDYYIKRAIEILRLSEIKDAEVRKQARINAITLIALARVYDEE